jgi:hypothetical protein
MGKELETWENENEIKAKFPSAPKKRGMLRTYLNLNYCRKRYREARARRRSCRPKRIHQNPRPE